MSFQDFSGWHHSEILLPAGERLICFYFRGQGKVVNTFDVNHNIFRLDKNGDVLWQVQRDENGILRWDSMHQHARERGEDGARWPFERLSIVFSDYSDNHRPQDGSPPPSGVWVPGC